MEDLIQQLSEPDLAPFLAASAVVLGLLALEVAFMLVGIDTTLDQPGAGDLADPGGTDLTEPGIALGFDHPELGEAPGHDAGQLQRAEPHWVGLLDLVGLAGLPLTVWLAFLSGAFAAAGLTLQAVTRALSGTTLPSLLAASLALVVAVPATRWASRTIRRLLPRETSSAISERSFGNRVGRVVVGTARRGSPAQVRFADGHGNTHYAMAEPLDDAEEIAAGAEVAILRTRDGALRLVRTG